MNKNEKLIESISGFFITMGKRDGYRAEHILPLLREIHFTALYHAICESACPVHAFAAISDVSGKLNYRSNPLFPGNATLIWAEETYHANDKSLSATRYLELWVRDDMTLAVVSCFRTVLDDEEYITEYREVKEDGWPVTDPNLDIKELFCAIQKMYPEEFDPDIVVVYES